MWIKLVCFFECCEYYFSSKKGILLLVSTASFVISLNMYHSYSSSMVSFLCSCAVSHFYRRFIKYAYLKHICATVILWNRRYRTRTATIFIRELLNRMYGRLLFEWCLLNSKTSHFAYGTFSGALLNRI